jgi:hypothetical protein
VVAPWSYEPDGWGWFRAWGGVVVYYSVVPLPAWPVSLAPFIVLGWPVVGCIVMAFVYRGNRAQNLTLAGAAMGEGVEEALVERYSITGSIPPPDAVR